ncbi:MAG: ABC transporter substrate-binding protein, partial [Gemmatimonadales bacterium]
MFFSRVVGRFALAGVVLVAACGGAERGREPALYLDDFADTILVSRPATRIVSLSPVTTEILFTLGAGDRVVGRTHWDLYPDAARAVADLGDGMQPNVEAVLGV